MGNNFVEALESYTIIDDPDVIAIESVIYGALESDNGGAELKKNLRKLAKAKAKDDKDAIREAKNDVDESIRELNNEANKEKDEVKKEKLKEIVKVGAIIAGTLYVAKNINAAIKELKKSNTIKQDFLEYYKAEYYRNKDRDKESK